MPYGIPKRFYGKTLDDYEVGKRRGSQEARDAVAEWIEHVRVNVAASQGLLLFGDPGGGKTMLASIAVQAAIDAGFTGAFTKYEAYVRRQHRMFKLERLWEEDAEAMVEWRTLDRQLTDWRNHTNVLVLDDVGKEHVTHTRYVEDELDFLLRHRHDRGLTTILTSNREPGQWAAAYSPSMESFLYEICELVPVNAPDYRVAKL